MPLRVRMLDDPQAVQALASSPRIEVLAALRQPDSAAGVARTIGQSRQSVNYHLKELARAGLVRHVGERRKGNMMEQLFEATARRFVVSPRFAWDRERLAAALRDQVSLANLVSLGERLASDATSLLDRAAYEGEQVPSAAVEAEVRFADETARSRFMEEYLAALGPLLKKYGSGDGDPYRVVLAAYPRPEDE